MAEIDSTYGAALLGLVVSACLYGITLLQAFSYFRNYSSDRLFIKSLVVILIVLDTMHLALCTRTVYWYLVTNFGNVNNLDLTTWSMALQTDCNGIIGLIVQFFFARRLWIMSQNWLITAVVVILALLHFGLGVVFTAESFILGRYSKFKSLTWVTCLGLGAAAVADIIIAAAMCYYLYTKRTGLRGTDSVLALLMVYSINSGLATSIIATLCVVLFGAMPTNFVWLGFFWIMGKCYVNSFLGLLNSRENLRDKVSGAVQLNHLGVQHFSQDGFSSGNHGSKPPRTNRLNGVAVSIETITDYNPIKFSKSTAAEREDRMDAIQEVEMKKHTSLRDDDNSV